MNYWVINAFVPERCADIRADVETHRQMHTAQPNSRWFEQRMLSLGLWLVVVGKLLQQRYEMRETKRSLNGI